MLMGSHLCSKLQALSSKIKQASVNGKWREVLCGYSEIQRAGIQFKDPFVFPIVFKACAKLSWLFQGRCIQASLLKRGFESFASVGNSIADFYMKCGDLCSAIREFDCMTSRDSVSWNVIVFGLLDHGFEEEGLWWFSKSRVWGFEPNVSTLVLVIHACRSLRSYVDGEKIHSYMIRSGFWGISSVQNSILCMYSECDFSSARKLFDEMSERDVISWSVVIRSYVQSHEPVLGLKLFQEMVREAKTEPDCVTVTSVLKACAVLEDIDVGRSVHGFSIRKGFDLADVFVCNSLIDMYSKGFDVDSAFRVFDEMATCRNIVSWNSILAGFVYNQRYDEALEIFRLMVIEAIEADEVTLVTLLQVCKFFEQPLPCKSIHCVIIRHGYASNEVALTSLIDAYTSCSLVDDARTVLDSMTYQDVVSCSTMISGLARSGRPDEAISIFCQMRDNPNAITVISLLNACSVSADLRKSKWAHGIAIRRGLAINDISVDTSIVDAYAKCGAIELARRTFNQIPRKNVVSWTVIISAFAINGLPDKALASFDEMKREGYKPNAVTYLAALSACNHGGLINKGLMIFKSMVEDHKPSLQHYSCVVDMFSRAGGIDTAMELIKNLPEDVKAGASAWGAILSGCRNRLKSGIITSEAVAEVLELEPLCSSGYLLASSAFAAEKSWDDVAMMRRLVKERKVQVVAGYSMVLEGSMARRFLAGDKLSHSDSELNDVVHSLHRCMTLDDTVGPRN